jgi:hypothetical protein
MDSFGATIKGGFNTMNMNMSNLLTAEQRAEANKLAQVGVEQAKFATRQGWQQTKIAGR